MKRRFRLPTKEEITLNISDTDYALAAVAPVRIKGLWLVRPKDVESAQICLSEQDAKELLGENEETLYPYPVEEIEIKARPRNFKEFIGQEENKKNLQIAIGAAKKENKPLGHILLHGYAGTGKTSLASLITKSLNTEIISIIAGAIQEKQDVINLLKQCKKLRNTSKCSVIFIDEIHSLDPKLGELFYTVMEDFKFNGQSTPHLTVIGATTEMGILANNLAPLIDRFELKLHLNLYTTDELKQIVLNLPGRLKTLPIEEEAAQIIANRSRKTARIAVKLYNRCHDYSIVHNHKEITVSDALETMKLQKINENGLTQQDIELLQYLANKNVVGLSGIAQRLRTSETNYQRYYEPFLVEEDYIERTPRGRKITEEGKNYLKTLSYR